MTGRYTRTAIALHWLIALLIICNFPLGLYMSDLHLSPLKLRLYAYHKWNGIVILALVILRLLWRSTHRPPPLPARQAPWERRLAQGVHHALYLLILVVPVSGWLMTSALGVPVVLFGVLPLPDLIGKNKELGDALKTVHSGLNYTLLAAFILHVAGALKHRFVDRDETLSRMSPFSGRKEP
jgi:cytochrome b561